MHRSSKDPFNLVIQHTMDGHGEEASVRTKEMQSRVPIADHASRGELMSCWQKRKEETENRSQQKNVLLESLHRGQQ